MRDDAYISSQGFGADITKVNAPDRDTTVPLRKGIQLIKQKHQRAFAASRTAENTERCACLDRKAYVVKNLRTAVVGKTDVRKINISPLGAFHGIFRVRFRSYVHNLKDSFKRNACLCHLGNDLTKFTNRPKKHRVMGKESN